MLYLLHGDNMVDSRVKRLDLVSEYRSNNVEVSITDGKTINIVDLKSAIEARSLFGQKDAVVVDNLLVFKGKGRSKAKTELIDYLAGLSKELNLILWEKKVISQSVVSKLSNFKSENYKIPNLMFIFLDGLGFNKTKTWNTFNNLLKVQDEEFIFLMLVRQLRLLLLSKYEDLKTVPDDFKRLVGWQKVKLTKQSDQFSINKLVNLYQKCLNIDVGVKTGQNILGLRVELEKLLLLFN